MKNNIYLLKSNLIEFPFFATTTEKPEDHFILQHSKWEPYNGKTYKFELLKNTNSGRKNYNFDISKYSSNLIIFSEKAMNILKDILTKNGTFVNIDISNNRHKFYGFYPNKNIYNEDIIDLNTSKYREVQNGKIFNKIKLNKYAPQNEYIFAIHQCPINCFVTDKFKKIVEDNDLVGFDFTEIAYEE